MIQGRDWRQVPGYSNYSVNEYGVFHNLSTGNFQVPCYYNKIPSIRMYVEPGATRTANPLRIVYSVFIGELPANMSVEVTSHDSIVPLIERIRLKPMKYPASERRPRHLAKEKRSAEVPAWLEELENNYWKNRYPPI